MKIRFFLAIALPVAAFAQTAPPSNTPVKAHAFRYEFSAPFRVFRVFRGNTNPCLSA
jgi:hypothetical protein